MKSRAHNVLIIIQALSITVKCPGFSPTLEHILDYSPSDTATGQYFKNPILHDGIYKLAQDWQEEISINSDNVVLDLQGKTAHKGISIAPFLSNIVIKNGIICNNNSQGINASGCTMLTISNVKISSCKTGIYLKGCNKGTLSLVTVKNCTETAIKIDACNSQAHQDFTVATCSTVNNNIGFEINNCDHLTMYDCIAIQSQQTGFF